MAVHWLAVLVGLTACYRPGSDAPCTVQCGAAGACPDGLTCDTQMNRCALANGSCGASDDAPGDVLDPDALHDAAIDVPLGIDAPENCVISTAAPTVTTLTVGSWFVPDRGTQHAVKLELGDIRETAGNVDTLSGGAYADAFPPPPIDTGYDAPRLAPGSTEMFVTLRSLSLYQIAIARRQNPGAAWSSPAPIVLKTGLQLVGVAATHVASPPTTTIPRRMLVSDQDAGALLHEYEEVNAAEWKRVNVHPLGFAPVIYLGQATLSTNGLRMVFRGQEPSQTVAGYYIDRPSVTATFNGAATKLVSGSGVSVSTPFLTEDCKHYYFTDPNGGFIYHVSYP